jgi:hypothetical protein
VAILASPFQTVYGRGPGFLAGKGVGGPLVVLADFLQGGLDVAESLGALVRRAVRAEEAVRAAALAAQRIEVFSASFR